MNLEEIKKTFKLYKLRNFKKNNRFDLIAKMNLRDMFPELTEEILTEYGPAIIKYLENEMYSPWHDDLSNWHLFNYLAKNNELDLINSLELKNSFKLNEIYSELTEEILTKYGPAIIKYLENEMYSPWRDDLSNWYLFNYLVKNDELDLINSLELINLFKLNEIYPELTEEILTKYGPAIIKHLERVDYSSWNNKCLLNYLKENNKFDLIAKMNLKVIFPELTEEILSEYGPAIIKYLERVYYSSWNDKSLLNYLKENNNRFDLIAKMSLEVIFPELTEEILTEYGPAIIKYLEIEMHSPWRDDLSNWHLFNYLVKNNELDLINSLGLINSFKLNEIYPELTEEILTKYGPAIIKYLERVDYSSWNDKCLLKYLKDNNRLDLIAKMNLKVIFPELTEEILTEYGPAIIKYIESVKYPYLGNECLLKYLIKHDRFDLTRKLSLNFENVENILPELKDSLEIKMENLRYQLSYLYNRNDEIFSTLNFKILKLNIPIEILPTITLYPDIQEKIINLDNEVSSKFLEIIDKVKNKEYDTAQVTESILNNVSNYEDLLNNLDINSLNENELNNLIYVLQNENNIFNISSIEDLNEENFKKKKGIYFRNIDNNLDNINLDSLKEAIVESIYGINLEKAKFISDRYSYDFEVLRKDGLDENIITIVENLNKIVNETDISKLKVIYQTRNDIPVLETNFMSSLSLEATIRKEYAKMYNDTLYQVSRDDLSKNSKLNNVTYNGKKIEIYEPGDEFHMQIHVMGAYDPRFLKPDNFKDSWLRPKIAYHGICTSFIANNEIATAKQNHPILGFSNYEEKALLLAGNRDLASNYANKSYAISNYNPCKFLPPKTMIDATRFLYNEMVIERVKQDSNNMNKRTPNYIVYIIDDINNNDNFDINNPLYQENLQAAYDFDVPIVVVDRLKYAKSEKEKCDSLERKFNDSRNPETLRELFLNYMNNWVGCRKFVENPEAEYNNIFNDEVVCEFYKRITNLIKNDIHEMKDINKTNEEILMMIRLLQHERDCCHFSIGKHGSFSVNNAINEYQELLNEFKSKLTVLKQGEVTQDVVLEETVSKTM